MNMISAFITIDINQHTPIKLTFVKNKKRNLTQRGFGSENTNTFNWKHCVYLGHKTAFDCTRYYIMTIKDTSDRSHQMDHQLELKNNKRRILTIIIAQKFTVCKLPNVIAKFGDKKK